MLLTTLLAAAVLNGASLPVLHPQNAQSSANTSTATAEGIEILRRILAETLDSAFRSKEPTRPGAGGGITSLNALFPNDNNIVTSLWAGDQTVTNSRGFHAPGLGVFFAFDVSLPVVSKEKKDEPTKTGEPSKDDEWERMSKQVRTNGGEGTIVLRGRVVSDEQNSEIDPKAIEQVIDGVLKTLARHASRVEGLMPADSLTVAMHLSGKSRMFFDEFTPNGRREKIEHADKIVTGDGDANGDTPSPFTYVLATGHGAPEQNLVIRVTLADLGAFADGNIERLRQRAQINRY